ncbi:biliverdin-producing heme oxygenase [Waterburya agarophytonicola K14]|uniref:heme oxygenase (biliverdin-producing) n=1 Tax=Waterburya agarophytonicola KI4 TaxID=2874699 RepID=A0A964FGS1_9CYAN|nr:biliverdin-producing heme oxygenase [Waterburya agarophytonicola]MCC0178391.1 biliverdin-producing heme oxygenase [Waterburya agarophytonicola KI4]
MTNNLATQLRQGTQKSHRLAEDTAYMQCFLQGAIEQEPFRQLLSNLYFVYSVLEEELLKHRDHIVINSIYFPQLNRKENLEADLAYYYGDRWNVEISPSEAARDYVSRLHQISATEPILLVAHAYVRYLGDLSGGQGLKNIIRNAFDLPEEVGTRFYEFDTLLSIGAIKEFKLQYRDALNSLPIDEELATEIVNEANYAFRLNCDLLHSLEPAVRASIGEDVYTKILSLV